MEHRSQTLEVVLVGLTVILVGRRQSQMFVADRGCPADWLPAVPSASTAVDLLRQNRTLKASQED